MCDFANMGNGYGQRFQQFEQNHPQFQKAWGAMTGAAQPGGDAWGRIQGLLQQQRPQTPVAPVQPPVANPPVQGGAMDA